MFKLISGKKHVFIDWIGVEAGYGTRAPESKKPNFTPSGVKLSVHKPVLEKEAVMIPDKRWEQFCINGYATFMEDEGVIRCWYECFPDPTKDDMTSLLCYAESDDGINWRKPSLGIYDFNGSCENNIIFNIHGASVFKDPKAPAGERYKLVFVDYNRKTPDSFLITGAVSSDGISWTLLKEPLMILPADTQTIAEYDTDSDKYVLYTRQTYSWNERFGALRRAISRSESASFYNWPEPEMILTNDPKDPPDWDYYTSGYTKWPGAKNAHLMFIDMYHRTKDTFDIHLATSRDSIIWHRPLGRSALIPNGPYGSFNDMMICATKGIIATNKGEWVNYVQCSRNGHNVLPNECIKPYGGYWRSVIREDGYMSLDADEYGEFYTVPVTFNGNELEINADIPYMASILVEIADVDTGKAFEGYSSDKCRTVPKNKLWKTVNWGENDISIFKNRAVRLHFKMFKAELFALRII